ncbi:hypothetical protein B0H11DRAFT_2268941 [Mycena galericulata]|nr:hypothetical protein B0H11DRAFT_2268941 [Mycena galericulata]
MTPVPSTPATTTSAQSTTIPADDGGAATVPAIDGSTGAGDGVVRARMDSMARMVAAGKMAGAGSGAGERTVGYKGKALRSWPQLPGEVIRLIATFHLHSASASAALPLTWDFAAASPQHQPHSSHPSQHTPYPYPPPQNSIYPPNPPHPQEHEDGEQDPQRARHTHIERARQRDREEWARPWPARLVYVAARDTRAMEVLMTVCPQWGVAVEHHNFWNVALGVLDPHNAFAHFGWLQPPAPAPVPQHSSSAAPAAAPLPVRVSPYRHFRTLLQVSCLPCRINAPKTSHGLGAARRIINTPRLGPIAVCREHAERRRTRFCGVCLRDAELARSVRAEAVKYARDDLARAEHALQTARWMNAGRGSMEAAYDVRDAAEDAVRVAEEAVKGAAGMSGPGEGVGVNEDEATFQGVHATCRACRAEWLWRQALVAAGERDADWEGGEEDTEKERERDSDRDGRGMELLRALGANVSQPGYFSPPDPQVRSTLTAFVDLAEGTVNHVLVVAGERGWLRTHTRWAELMGQALAARKFNAGAGGGDRGYAGYATTRLVKSADRPRGRGRSLSPESVDDEYAFGELGDGQRGRGGRTGTEAYANNAANVAVYASAGYTNTSADEYDLLDEEYDEDDSELEDELSEDEDEMAAALESSVKELALGDWARGRILDGAWVAPADVYYGVRVGGLDTPENPVKATHPVPWAVSPPPSPPGHATSTATPVLPTPLPADAPPTTHPGPPAPSPPTYALAEAAHAAHMRQMRVVLLPAFRNVVRRVVVECALDAREGGSGGAADPAMRAARMSLADVVREVREEEGVWFDGVDWTERRRNARAEAATERERERERRHRTEGSDDSSEGTSRTSDTSPVLSTSTLGTTPSPPPLGEHRKDADAVEEARRAKEARERQPTIAVMPVLDPPRLLHPIPHVPETIAHLPMYSLEALRAVWREACAPLYHCRCTICERAMAAAQATQGGHPAKTTPAAAPAPTPAAKDEGPLVLQLPTEDDTGGRGAESVVSLVEEDDGLTAQERYWRQVEEDEGPGAAEREMALVEEMQAQYRYSGAGGGGDIDDDYSDIDDFEEEEGAGVGKYALGPAPAAWVAGAGRKRSVDELEPERGADGARAHTTRGGTPPKRARTGEPDYSTVRLVKRGSEELDVDEADVETASVGSAPKRARIDAADSPPTSSTPSTLSGEESAVSHERELRRRMRENIVAAAGFPPI